MTSLVWNDPGITNPADKLVMLALAHCVHGDDEVCWPSIPTLVRMTAMSRRSIFRSISKLVAISKLRIDHGGGRHKPNRYFITVPTGHLINSAAQTPLKLETVPTVHETVPTVQSPNIMNGKEREGAAGVPVFDPEEIPVKLRTQGFSNAWKRWMTHRRAFKKPKSWAALFEDQMEFLQRYDAPTAEEIIRHSLRGGYQGLFPPRQGSQNKPPTNCI